MKRLLVLAVMAAPFFASCAYPLEQRVEARRQQRLEDACANQPIIAGARDGVGQPFVAADQRLTLSDQPILP